MKREKPKMTIPALLLLLTIIGSTCVSVGLVVWAVIEPYFRVEEPVESGIISEDQFTKWKNVCDALIGELADEHLDWIITSFPESLNKQMKKHTDKSVPLCEKNGLSLEKFVFISGYLGEARSYYRSYETKNAEDRSIFPVDLLPQDYDGPLPEEEPVFTKETYNSITNAVLVNNLKLYDKFRSEIEEIMYDLVEPVETNEENSEE